MRKSGRDQLPVLPMHFPFACQESVAQNGPRKNPQQGALLELVDAFNENLRHQFRRVNQHDVDASEIRAADARDSPTHLLQQPNAIREKSPDGLQE